MREHLKGVGYAGLHHEFTQAIEVGEYQHSLESRRLLSGENPFKVWREHFCEKKHVVAEILDVTDVDYVLIEEGEIEPTPEDIVRFSQYFDIHPIDMVVQNPMSNTMVNALLIVYSDPTRLGKSQHNTKTKMVLDTIAKADSFINLDSEGQLLHKNSPVKSALIIHFIDSVLRSDGEMKVEPLDIFDYASVLRDMYQDKALFLNDRISKLTQEWSSYSQSYHRLGRALFGQNWKSIDAKLFSTLRKSPIDDVMVMYMNDPNFVGLNAFTSDANKVTHQGQSLTWREAQREHWKYVETTFLASQERIQTKVDYKNLTQQIDEFDRWIHQNFDILHDYDNRQSVLAHHDFKAARRNYTPIVQRRGRRFTL